MGHTISLTRPQSTIPALTGIVGVGTLLIIISWLHHNPFNLLQDANAMLALGIVAVSMISMEIIIRLFGFHATCDVDFHSLTWGRIYHALNRDFLIKIYGLSIIFLGSFFVYKIFPFYTGQNFAIVFKWASYLITYGIIGGVIYIWLTHALQKDKFDSLWHFGRFFVPFGNRNTLNTEKVKEQALSWGIKIFFLPLMASFFFDWWDKIANYDIFFTHTDLMFKTVFDLLFNLFYLIDIVFGVIGYTATFQLLNTHIRYPEIKLKGWVVTIVMYNPLSPILFQQLAYQDGLEWGQYFGDSPILYVIYGIFVLLTLAIYTMASVMMGLRMSNLTYRGITTSGPYAFTKHPAYLSKCLSWWMIEIPFIAASPWLAIKNSVMLGLICGLYTLRARCEEQMLARVDPMYRDYQNYIRTTGGLWPRAKRFYSGHIAPLLQMLEPPKPS